MKKNPFSSFLFAVLLSLSASAAAGASSVKLDEKDIQALPYLIGPTGSDLGKRKFKPGTPGVPDELFFSKMPPVFRIYGKRKSTSNGVVAGSKVYGIGKVILLPDSCTSGTLTYKKKVGNVYINSVMEQPNGELVYTYLPLEPGKSYRWSVESNGDSEVSMEVLTSDKKRLIGSYGALAPLRADVPKVLGRGFAAVCISSDGEVDISFTAD